jgi:hypothetical protein
MLMAAEAMPMVANMIENDSQGNLDEIMLSLD